ncbi:MAG: hypothetical protein AB7T49_17185 [Oligoflexales bacterium]
MKKTHIRWSLGLFATFALVTNCGDSEFTGDNGKKAAANQQVDQQPGAAIQQTFEVGATEARSPVDIVIAMDTSRSMIEEKADLEKNMTVFFNQLQDQGVDAHIIAMGSGPSHNNSGFEFPEDLPKEKFAVVEKKVGSHDAISILNEFYSEGSPPLPFRSEAGHEVVIITDDNADGAGNNASDFDSKLGKKVTVNAIIGLTEGQDPDNSNCNIQAVGNEYKDLSQSTDGLVLDLCIKDWGTLVKDLANSIVNRSEKKFQISQKIDSSKAIKVTLNGNVLAASDYQIDPQGALTVLAETKKGDKIIVEFYSLP